MAEENKKQWYVVNTYAGHEEGAAAQAIVLLEKKEG